MPVATASRNVAPPAASTAVPLSLDPVEDQIAVLYSTIVFVVISFALWTAPIIRYLINPIKLLTIGWHELCHVIAAILTGGSITSVSIDPNVGGCTQVEGGNAKVILASGYIGSTLLGGALVLGGWHLLAAKIESFFIAFGLIVPVWLVRDKLTMALIVLYEGLLIGFWFIEHGAVLRWYCLFVGVINTLYVIWDICDQKFYKTNDSDVNQFAILFPGTKAHWWACFWILHALVTLICFTLIGLYCFKLNSEEMRAAAAVFLPT